MYGCGKNDMGQLGTGDNDDHVAPEQVKLDVRVQQIACGHIHSCACTAYGEVFTYSVFIFITLLML